MLESLQYGGLLLQNMSLTRNESQKGREWRGSCRVWLQMDMVTREMEEDYSSMRASFATQPAKSWVVHYKHTSCKRTTNCIVSNLLLHIKLKDAFHRAPISPQCRSRLPKTKWPIVFYGEFWSKNRSPLFFRGKADLSCWARRGLRLFQNGYLARQRRAPLRLRGVPGAPYGPGYTILKVFLRAFTDVQF